MFFELKDFSDKKLADDYERMMSELNDFFGINWVRNRPKIFFVESRKQIDTLRNQKTEDWSVGWVKNTEVYVLKNEKMEEESSHKKYSDTAYYAFIKHELAHCFTNVLLGNSKWIPKWLWEGVATYVSGQNNIKENKIREFKDFLSFYEQGSVKGVYNESGWAVECLVNKFGKEKLLCLIKNLKDYPSKELFEKAFEKQYGLELDYESFNKLLK
jgi:hypothetical protein